MIPIALSKLVNVIPKKEASSVLITIEDEFTKQTFTQDVFSYSNGYLSFTCPFETTINRQYTIQIVEDGQTIFKGKCIGVESEGETVTVLMLDGNTAIMLNSNEGLLL